MQGVAKKMNKKKVVFVAKALWIGGIETALMNLLNQFDYNKYDVTLLVIHAELNLLDRIPHDCRVVIADREKGYTFKKEYKYATLYHLTEDTENPSVLHKLFMWTIPIVKWIENRLYIRYLRRGMRKEHFDTCVIYSDVVAEMAIRSVDADRYLMFYHHGAMRHMYHDRIAYKKCENIIAVSQNLADELKRFVPSAAGKVVAIHNLTDIDGVKAKAMCQTEDEFDKNRYHIVSVGRVSPEKGMDIAVQACAKLVEEGLKDICWWIVGDGPAMDDIKRVVTELHMEPYMRLVGMKDNPYPYIRQADLYVQPSRVEAFGLTITEAMILGKPVVATNTQGAREILTAHNNGRLCEIDSGSLALQIKQLIAQPQYARNLEQGQMDSMYIDNNLEAMKKLEALL